MPGGYVEEMKLQWSECECAALNVLMTSTRLIFMTNNRIYAFVYGLFNDVACASHPIDYNDRIISE